MDSLVVGDLIFFAAGDVAHLLKSERHRVVGPNVDGVSQDGVNRLGHVKVAHASAGDPGRPCARPGLVQKNDVLAAALAFRLKLHGQVPGGAQPMDAATDDDVGDRFGYFVLHLDLQKHDWPRLEIGGV